jgi:uncharacterized membrane protein YraQ (UPF0718 family)
VLQSLPFVLLGILASALVQEFLSDELLERRLPRGRISVVLLASVFGFVAPVCDCGVIPLARRLGAKGVPLHATTAFIVAAPVVNPVVLVATLVAFQGSWTVVALRMGMTWSVAVLIGLLVARLGLAARRPLAPPPAVDDAEPGSRGRSFRAVVTHAAVEFTDVIFFVVLGALFTAVTQTFVPRGDLLALGGAPVASVAVLMPVATLLSICSEADAFVARAFATTFSLGAVLAFMTIGQIVDLRNGFLLLRALPGRVVALMVGAAYAAVFAQGVLVNLLATAVFAP